MDLSWIIAVFHFLRQLLFSFLDVHVNLDASFRASVREQLLYI